MKGLLSEKTGTEETETGQVLDGENLQEKMVLEVQKEVALVKSECEGELNEEVEDQNKIYMPLYPDLYFVFPTSTRPG